jgi:ATP-dependent Clp protease protease subunit
MRRYPKPPRRKKKSSGSGPDDPILQDYTFSTEEDLWKKGIYYITGEIEEGSLADIHQDILLKHLDPAWVDDVQIFINTVGGHVSEGWAFIDLLDYVRMDVRTVGLGEVCSLGSLILAAGSPGKRVSSPNTSIMIHSFYMEGYVQGNRHQMVSQMKSVEQEHLRHVRFWTTHSSHTTKEEVERAFLNGKDIYLTPEEAIQHGIIDGITKAPIKKSRAKKK